MVSMSDLTQPTSIQNNIFVTSRQYYRVIRKTMLHFLFFRAKTIGWIASYVDFSRQVAYLCNVRLGSKSSSGDNRITLRGSFSTSHLATIPTPVTGTVNLSSLSLSLSSSLSLSLSVGSRSLSLSLSKRCSTFTCLEPKRIGRSQTILIFRCESTISVNFVVKQIFVWRLHNYSSKFIYESYFRAMRLVEKALTCDPT